MGMLLRRAGVRWASYSRGVTSPWLSDQLSPHHSSLPSLGALPAREGPAVDQDHAVSRLQGQDGGATTGWGGTGRAAERCGESGPMWRGRVALGVSSSSLQARGFSSGKAANAEDAGQLSWPLDNEQMGGLDSELQEAIELDIFAERDNLPEAVREALERRNPTAAAAATTPDGTLAITRSSLESLQAGHLQELLARVGEDAKGPKADLVDRLFALLEELWEVQVQTGGTPTWAIVDEEADEQRQFARVFAPEEVAEILVKARTQDITIVDLRHVDEMRFTDYFVLATARSDRHMMASAGAVVYALKQRCCEVIPGKAPVVEGDMGSQWVCVDAGSIVAHVFLQDARQRVDLESLWVKELGATLQHVEQPETIHTIQTMKLEEGAAGGDL
eukprot:CAMPEP_0117668950 /NCGR_PEP_ID=MMETSP0804-20121206/11846_1 /TAXON_ID=1074897 /ORGANISM="Tetraselmis astigmatica, Strain CCMP880" /LENGTH=389 /DNA_ID=CAMNT_0005476923 /DNA_START=229 /DNA_END=1398 /DNA_ORIENTATION=-